MSDDHTVEVTLSADDYERLAAVADDPADLFHEAGMRRVLLEEAIEGTVGGDAGPTTQRSGSEERPIAPVGVLLGFEPVSIGGGESTVEMNAGPEHANPMGTLHGGVVCDLGDAAMGMAYASTLGPEESFTTLELGVNYLRPVRSGRLTASGSVVHGGRTVGLVECDVTDEDDRLVARLSSTCLTLRGDAARGR
jgi:uncharacterized protein (TIGR00369 family)